MADFSLASVSSGKASGGEEIEEVALVPVSTANVQIARQPQMEKSRQEALTVFGDAVPFCVGATTTQMLGTAEPSSPRRNQMWSLLLAVVAARAGISSGGMDDAGNSAIFEALLIDLERFDLGIQCRLRNS
jgi:hypothetical protein